METIGISGSFDKQRAKPKQDSLIFSRILALCHALCLLRNERNDNGNWIVCQPDWKVQATLYDLVKNVKQIPAYFGVGLTVAGQAVLSSNNLSLLVQSSSGKGSGAHWIPYTGPVGSPPAILASATRVEDDVEYLRLNVHLISPQMLYLRQRDRTLWFGSLIAVSSLAALIGLVLRVRLSQTTTVV